MTSSIPRLAVPPDGNKADIQPLSEAAQGAFFAAMLEHADQATARTGAQTRHLDIGGQVFRLVFAGPALEAFAMPALEHLETQAREPDVTFRIWDGAQSGVPMLEAPCGKECLTERGDIWGMDSPRFLAAFRRFDSSLSVFDTERALGVYWVSGRDSIPSVDRAAPFCCLFGWALRSRQRALVPAASVATAAGAVLLLGPAALRSAISATCAAAGLDVLGDRHVIVSAAPEHAVLPLYALASPLTEPTLAEAFRIEHPSLPLVPARADRPKEGTALRAILACEQPPAVALSVLPADRDWMALATALAAVSAAPCASPQLPAMISTVAAKVRSLWFRLGEDLATVPQTIQQVLEAPPTVCAPKIRRHQEGLSVVVPAFNGAHFLAGAVASILHDGPDPLDLIVVDDGSADDIEATVAALPIPARLLRQANLGPAAARNRGIGAARFGMIGFLDVDDLWPAGRLAALWAEFVRRPEAMVARGHAQLFRAAGTSGATQFLGAPGEAFPDYIGAGLFRRAAFDRIGLFDAELRFSEDVDWFARAREQELFLARAPIVSLLVRRHAANMTRARSATQSFQLRAFHRHLERRRKREREPG